MSRAFCYRCHRVASNCICQQSEQIDNPVSVYLLQHPDETRHSKGSAIIASLCLQHYCCWQGEDFTQHKALNQLLEKERENIAVLYPSADALSIDQVTAEKKQAIRHLIVIDATWRKAKKIWSLSSNLHQLQTVRLSDDYISRYRIRKVPADGYLSTVEAIAYCLTELENEPQKYLPMLKLFDQLIDQQISAMGQDVYQKNYENKT